MKTVPASSPVPDRPAQKFAPEQLSTDYSAMVMVSKPGLTRFVIALLFKVEPPPIPMKGFSDEASAKEWLRQFVATERRTARY